MKRLMCITALISTISATGMAQPAGDTTVQKDPTGISVYELLYPSFQTSAVAAPSNPFPSAKPLGEASKLLLGLGTNLFRGDNENYSIYSYEDAWKYPGPTVRYPENITEFELFLERYSRYATPSQ